MSENVRCSIEHKTGHHPLSLSSITMSHDTHLHLCILLFTFLLLLGFAPLAQGETVPLPTSNQLKAMDIGLAMFIHFSVNPWESIEHNCVGDSSDCIPASEFNPTDLSTDQWVETAVAFGAKEICLTAHHEGGFCLWNTNYTDYNVMNSPYGKDIVKEFVASCQKYNVKPCYYMGPNANGYLTNKLKYTAEAFVEAQLGMLTELLENYDLKPSRLWWDHYPKDCSSKKSWLNPCPVGSFPDAYPKFIELVREKSPDTIICPGPDCDGHQGESGIANYPVWYPCQPINQTKNAGREFLQCKNHAPDSSLTGFHPYEACATMNDGWFCKADGSHAKFWEASKIWDHYMDSVAVGYINTLNAPVCTTGKIADGLVKEMKRFGRALQSLWDTVHASASDIVGEECQNTTLVELPITSSNSFNAIVLKEDLSRGQRIVSYALDYFDGDEWVEFTEGVHGKSVGSLLIDWVQPPPQQVPRTKVRVRCLDAIQVPVYLKNVSVHSGTRPTKGEEEALEDASSLALG